MQNTYFIGVLNLVRRFEKNGEFRRSYIKWQTILQIRQRPNFTKCHKDLATKISRRSRSVLKAGTEIQELSVRRILHSMLNGCPERMQAF